jgi:rhodanese-related sulfurtransferase
LRSGGEEHHDDHNKGSAEGEDGPRGDFALLEVLEEASYKRAHVPGAIRFQDVYQAAGLRPDKSLEIVAYCSDFT